MVNTKRKMTIMNRKGFLVGTVFAENLHHLFEFPDSGEFEFETNNSIRFIRKYLMKLSLFCLSSSSRELFKLVQLATMVEDEDERPRNSHSIASILD